MNKVQTLFVVMLAIFANLAIAQSAEADWWEYDNSDECRGNENGFTIGPDGLWECCARDCFFLFNCHCDMFDGPSGGGSGGGGW